MKKMLSAVLASIVLVGASVQADPINLSPGDETYSGLNCGLCGPGVPAILNWLNANVAGFDSSDERYKSDEDGDATGTDSGPFASEYTTTYSNPVGDPGNATISWNGGGFLAGAEWLLVKDGNNSPIWYLFDITSWDGISDIIMTGFWPRRGAISHVAVYGGDRGQIPEPGTLALLGLGLVGAGLVRRRRQS